MTYVFLCNCSVHLPHLKMHAIFTELYILNLQIIITTKSNQGFLLLSYVCSYLYIYSIMYLSLSIYIYVCVCVYIYLERERGRERRRERERDSLWFILVFLIQFWNLYCFNIHVYFFCFKMLYIQTIWLFWEASDI